MFKNRLHMIYTRLSFCELCIHKVLILSSCREEKDEEEKDEKCF
jgi:hypothetical protein